MKIKHDPPKIIPSNSPSQKVDNRPTAKSFKRLLVEKMATDPATPEKLSDLPALLGPLPLHLNTEVSGIDETKIDSKLENLLDILEQYKEHLENPRITLKQMGPLIQKMAAKTEQLIPELENLGAEDSLKPILNAALVTSTLELNKLASGWYNT